MLHIMQTIIKFIKELRIATSTTAWQNENNTQSQCNAGWHTAAKCQQCQCY